MVNVSLEFRGSANKRPAKKEAQPIIDKYNTLSEPRLSDVHRKSSCDKESNYNDVDNETIAARYFFLSS